MRRILIENARRKGRHKRGGDLQRVELDPAQLTTASPAEELFAIDDALECLRSAKACWSRGEGMPTPELVWDQLWSILEEGGVLRKTK